MVLAAGGIPLHSLGDWHLEATRTIPVTQGTSIEQLTESSRVEADTR
jgi:hypothetical protein